MPEVCSRNSISGWQCTPGYGSGHCIDDTAAATEATATEAAAAVAAVAAAAVAIPIDPEMHLELELCIKGPRPCSTATAGSLEYDSKN